jgi:hypothetical protein
MPRRSAGSDADADDLIDAEDAVEPPGVIEGLTKAERVEEFLRLLGEGLTVRKAAAASRTNYVTLYRRRKEDPAFAKRWEDAQRISIPRLETEAFRRAMLGSDKLLMFILERRAQHLYGAKQSLDVTSSDGSMSPAPASNEERIAKVEALLAVAKARKQSSVDDLI